MELSLAAFEHEGEKFGIGLQSPLRQPAVNVGLQNVERDRT
jgi:hypothetical protein